MADRGRNDLRGALCSRPRPSTGHFEDRGGGRSLLALARRLLGMAARAAETARSRVTPVLARYVDVSGTWSVRGGNVDDWNSLTSAFTLFRRQHGLAPFITDPRRLYEWSTDLDGLPGDGGHAVWDASGRSFANYFISPWTGRLAIPSCEVNVFSQSHGDEVVLYACGRYGLKINTWIDIAGPVRGDMLELAKAARPNIRRWLHLYAGFKDRWQLAGELFGGGAFRREQPYADINAKMPGGHSDIVRDPSYFHYWVEQGWFGW